ncbi:hypothetical protein ACFSQJ_18670 [Croceitalea marina]|uniref:Bacterial Pleckstrin homology domain-containing protein n=1 Tax=Croceitalea marina TaxID=1775166 RepID=A0ABW5N1H0_9FLAO
MKKKNKNWFWNIVIVLTLIVCVLAFVLHYKNWSKFEDGHFQVVSGIYKQRILLSDIDSIGFVEKLPEMERSNGFSWLAKEKGVFKDSLTESKVYVFVDDLRQQKIRIVHHDSLKLFLNFSDSLEIDQVYTRLKEVLKNSNE